MSSITCAFYKGTGKDPFDLAKYAFNKGTGINQHTRISCTACECKEFVRKIAVNKKI